MRWSEPLSQMVGVTGFEFATRSDLGTLAAWQHGSDLRKCSLPVRTGVDTGGRERRSVMPQLCPEFDG